MNKSILEETEEEVRFALSDSKVLAGLFDAILKYYLDEINRLKRKIEILRKEANR